MIDTQSSWVRSLSRGFSLFGIGVCAGCGFLVLLCVAAAYATRGDPAGSALLLQLPLALPLKIVTRLGLDDWYEQLSAVEAYVCVLAPAFLAIYAAGWLLEFAVALVAGGEAAAARGSAAE